MTPTGMRPLLSLFLASALIDCTSNQSRVERNKFETIKLSQSDSISIYDENDEKKAPQAVECEYFESIQPTQRLQDKNTEHLLFAQNIGLEYGYTTDASFKQAKDSLLQAGLLVPICDNQYYRIKDMEHSHPYLTHEAAELLEEIGIRFQENLKQKHQKEYAVYITSALRTDEGQRKLFRKNKNATHSTTSHLYGTTFDISYMEFFRNDDSKIIRYKNVHDILTKTLQEMRMEKCCLVLREVKQQCFHITVIQ